MRTLLASAAIAALLVAGSVAAQTGTGSGTTPTPPAQNMEQPQAPDQPTGKAIISQQNPDQLMAKDLLGSPVVTPDGKKVGVVRDLILDTQGKLTGLVIASGSFLGIGGKAVGVSTESVQIGPSPSGEGGDEQAVLVQLSSQDIENAPEFRSKGDMDQNSPM